MKFLAPLVLAVVLLFASGCATTGIAPKTEPELETVALRDVGQIVIDTTSINQPDLERLRGLIGVFNEFVSDKCQCTATFTNAGWTMKVLSYEAYEEYVLSVLDISDPYMAEAFREEGGLVAGFTTYPATGPMTHFYQWPNDFILIHELMHVAYPADPEPATEDRTHHFLSSKLYKDWLRDNYDDN